MGIFDKAKDALGEHGDKVDEGIDKAGDFADEKTGGEHADKIDQGQEFAKDRLDGLGGNQDDNA
ncbi:antitoxin [Kribbella sp. NPDC005582]|uniref:antitoxin n=1 Tax=Kribbella sp. NPDC005582 TaxID=3156893 RepID=UPI0033A039E5